MPWPHGFLAEKRVLGSLRSAALGSELRFLQGGVGCSELPLCAGRLVGWPTAVMSRRSWTLGLGFLTPVLTPELMGPSEPPLQGLKIRKLFQCWGEMFNF